MDTRQCMTGMIMEDYLQQAFWSEYTDDINENIPLTASVEEEE